MRPGPPIIPISLWIHEAAAAASKLFIPWAMRPAQIPAKTSPDPAVARKGDDFSDIRIFPKWEATMLSFPFNNIVALESSAAFPVFLIFSTPL